MAVNASLEFVIHDQVRQPSLHHLGRLFECRGHILNPRPLERTQIFTHRPVLDQVHQIVHGEPDVEVVPEQIRQLADLLDHDVVQTGDVVVQDLCEEALLLDQLQEDPIFE